jgi:hypothetical protein
VIILLAVVAWFVFGGGLRRQTTYRADIKVTPPATSPQTGGSAGGTVAIPPTQPR